MVIQVWGCLNVNESSEIRDIHAIWGVFPGITFHFTFPCKVCWDLMIPWMTCSQNAHAWGTTEPPKAVLLEAGRSLSRSGAHPLVLQDPHHPGRVPGPAALRWNALIVQVGHNLTQA